MPNELKQRDDLPSLPRAARATADYGLCAKCNCSWFQEIRVARVDRNRVLVPGQEVPKLSESMVLLRCVRCDALHEPIVSSSTSHVFKMHKAMIEELNSVDTIQSSTVEKIEVKE